MIAADPDIDMHDPTRGEWPCAFRTPPARRLIDAQPGEALDPTTDRKLPFDRQAGSVIGIDATFLYGREVRALGVRS